MIRKIILVFIIGFLSFWLITAYIIKSNVKYIIDRFNSDSFKILYDDASVSGFPFGWKIKIDHPRFTRTTLLSSVNYEFDYIDFVFSISLKKIKMYLGKQIIVRSIYEDNVREYKILSNDEMIASLYTDKNIYFIDDLDHEDLIEHFLFDAQAIAAFDDEKQIFSLGNLGIEIKKGLDEQYNKFGISVICDFENDDDLAFTKASLESKLNYLSPKLDLENKEFDRKIDFKRFFIKLDDSYVDLIGSIMLYKKNLPHGSFDIEFKNYRDVVDILVPDDFVLPQEYIKESITKAIFDGNKNRVDSDIVNLKMEFSDTGIVLDNIKFLEAK